MLLGQKKIEVIDELVEFSEDYTDSTLGTQLVIKRTQEIPDWYLDALAEKRNAPHDSFGNKMTHLCSIPNSIVAKWEREGYPWQDIYHGPNGPAVIMQKLRDEDMQKFLASSKRF